jgi:dUTPase
MTSLFPDYATAAAAGADLLAAIDQDIELGPLERRIVPTGISIALPVGFEGPGCGRARAGGQEWRDGGQRAGNRGC